MRRLIYSYFPSLPHALIIDDLGFTGEVRFFVLLKVTVRDAGLVVLRLNVPVNNFSVMSGRSHRFLGN